MLHRDHDIFLLVPLLNILESFRDLLHGISSEFGLIAKAPLSATYRGAGLKVRDISESAVTRPLESGVSLGSRSCSLIPREIRCEHAA